MKNITLSADERLIEAARERAQAEHTTLNEQFRVWLAGYAQARQRMQDFDQLMTQPRGALVVGQTLDREAMNER